MPILQSSATGGGAERELSVFHGRFEESYEDRRGSARFSVVADPLGTEPFVASVPGVPAGGDANERFRAAVEVLLRRGELSLPPMGARDRVADLLTAAGVPFARHEVYTRMLKRARREAAGGVVELRLKISSIDRDIFFSETWVYFPRPGDRGREYAYGVATPYTSLSGLLEYLEGEPRDGVPQERLLACFQERVDQGAVGDYDVIKDNRDRVAAWLEDAGLPHDLSSFAEFD
jgi:hypothetical protein